LRGDNSEGVCECHLSEIFIHLSDLISQAAAISHREEVALYQAIRVMLTKGDHTSGGQRDAEREALIKQALSQGIVPEVFNWIIWSRLRGLIGVFGVAYAKIMKHCS